MNNVIANLGVSVPYATVSTNATLFVSVDKKNLIDLNFDAVSTIRLNIVKLLKLYEFHFIGQKLSVSNIEMPECSVIEGNVTKYEQLLLFISVKIFTNF